MRFRYLLGFVAALAGCSGQRDRRDAMLPKTGSNPAQSEQRSVPRERSVERRSEVPTDTAPTRLGRCRVTLDAMPLWTIAGQAAAFAPRAPRYERFRQLRVIAVGASHLSIADISDDGTQLLAVSEAEAMLRLYDPQNGLLLAKHAVSGYARFGMGDFVLWESEATTPRVVFGGEAGLSVLDGASGATLSHVKLEQVWQLGWSRDRSVLGANHLSPTGTSSLAFFAATAAGELLAAFALACEERIDGWALDASKTLLAATHYPSGDVVLYDLRERAERWRTPGPEYARSVDISPTAPLVAVGGSEAWLLALDDPAMRTQFTRFDNNVHSVRFSPEGTALAVSAYDGRARILGASLQSEDLRLIKLLRHGGTANVYAIDFTRDGTRMVTSSGDQTIRIWGE